jgi:hypothetical protein|tara:strand:- start:237 stop:467 length:231 start_codon:yes stop_codon:yes gene_type:complete
MKRIQKLWNWITTKEPEHETFGDYFFNLIHKNYGIGLPPIIHYLKSKGFSMDEIDDITIRELYMMIEEQMEKDNIN